MITFFDSITFSQDEELICTTTQSGLNIYDTNRFNLIYKLDPFRIGLTGDIIKAKILFNTRIIGFSMIESKTTDSKVQQMINSDYRTKKHNLILYDLKDDEIIGKITMKKNVEIKDFLITKYFIIIIIEDKNKCILFKTSNFEYFKTISEVELGKIVYSDDYYIQKYKSKKNNDNIKNNNEGKKGEEIIKNNKCILAFLDSNDKKIIHLKECIFNNNGTKILGIKNRDIEIEINFNSNEIKYLDIISPYLIIASSFGNKVHLYDISKGIFKYCLFLGNFPYELSGVHLDNKGKIITIITNNKYIKLYKLNKLSIKCNCASHNDEKIAKGEKRGMFDKFKHKIGVGRNDFLCRYKINYKDFDMKDSMTLVFFDKNVNDAFYIIQNDKTVKKLKFDRKKNKNMILLSTITLPKYTLNKNNLRTLNLIMEEEKRGEQKKKKEEENNIFLDDEYYE